MSPFSKGQMSFSPIYFNTFAALPEISRTENVTSQPEPEISQVNWHDTITCCQPILFAMATLLPIVIRN